MTLLDQYKIQGMFNNDGSFGTIFQVSNEDGQVFLAKITENHMLNYKEHRILEALNRDEHQKMFPKVYGAGKFEVKGGKEYSFIIIEQLGDTLQDIM